VKLSEVKTDADWEEYLYRKSIQTHEQLKAEMGMGPHAWRLPAAFNSTAYDDAGVYPDEDEGDE
jgi:hypothetical protein